MKTLILTILMMAATAQAGLLEAYWARSGGGGGAWTPASISPSAWYNSTTISVTPSNTISAWSDAMDNSSRRLFQNTGSAQPIYSNSAAWFNNSTMVISSTNPFCYAAGSMTLMFIAKGTNVSTGQSAPSVFSETSTTLSFPVYSCDIGRYDVTPSGMRMFMRNDAYAQIDGTEGGGITGGNGVFINTVKLYSVNDYGNSVTNYVDGTNYVAAAYTRSGTMSVNRMSLGGWQRAALALPYNGFIYEVIISAPAMTESNRLKCEGYLAWKHGIQGNLPANHPYKGSAP